MQASTAPVQPDIGTITRADLDAATARTAAVMQDPQASPQARLEAAQAEMEAFDGFWHTRPDAQAELEAGI